MSEREQDERLTRALESAPAVMVPDDFALRVMAGLPERKTARGFVPSNVTFGRHVFVAAMVALAALMVGFAYWASHAAGLAHGTLVAVELTLCAEFVGLTLWMTPRFASWNRR